MNLRGRLLLYLVLIAVITTAAFKVTRKMQPQPPSREAIGLEWLQHEYQIGAEAFDRIVKMHRDYFARCEAMCAQMIEARHPSRTRAKLALLHASEQSQPAIVSKAQQKAICESCLDTMISHLQAVAAEMEPEQGRRFLSDILPEVTNPRELRELIHTKAAPRSSND